ncbi:DNA-binding response regulator [Cellvibrio zantedeschiae]|uniref:DNA-binding response regulator n=1 Tax=Cellvibrio zantedeschiae TaxID=1237077 RepID=A0ABQ3B641_9GAMM|nr:response regulator transcription factor [Cellvibrio zantedeschiae]GGY75487.1 DNA-binding response regulator [Cellvibrio zantedeschiae]
MKSSERFLIVDDDSTFAQVMQRALVRRGFEVDAFNASEPAIQAVQDNHYSKAIIDLKIAQESGLTLIKNLKTIQADLEIIMLTGYSSIPTAVEAIKLGALNYLCKPVDIDEILLAFSTSQIQEEISLPENPISLDRLEWEHIQKTLQDNNGNVSATARLLGMHRRTLQRKLQKRPVNN